MNDQLYEINVKRFLQTTEYQLKKLTDIVIRLKEFQEYEDWKNVKQAQLNGSQIIKRIKSDIKEIEKIRHQIVSQLESTSSNKIVAKIDEELKDITKRLQRAAEEIDSLSAPYHTISTSNPTEFIEANYAGPEMFAMKVHTNEYLSKDQELCNSYDQLQKDCEDLKYLMETFSNEIFKQKPTIDAIENNVVETKGHIDSGAANLTVALRYKAISGATSGALIGSLVAGPVGFIAGAKIGAVFGLGGSFFGYILGKLFSKPVL